NCGGVDLSVKFLSPLLASDLDLYSRPVSFITFTVKSLDGNQHDVKLYFNASADIAKNKSFQAATQHIYKQDGIVFEKSGTNEQAVLKKKGDDVRIDWGYFYLAAAEEVGVQLKQGTQQKTDPVSACDLGMDLGKIKSVPVEKKILLAYDDLYSIQY